MNPTHNTTATDPTPADVLRRAADHIDRYGFNQGSYYDNTFADCPATCAAGAIAIGTYGEPILNPDCHPNPAASLYNQALGWLQAYLDANLDRHEGHPIGVYAWNDSPNTTGTDVVDTLRAAALAWDIARAGGEA